MVDVRKVVPTLKDLEVLDVLVLGVGVELHLEHRIWVVLEDAVVDLA